jgi:putative flippase GtrA
MLVLLRPFLKTEILLGVAGLAGSTVGVVWNYAVSSVFTWGVHEPVPAD